MFAAVSTGGPVGVTELGFTNEGEKTLAAGLSLNS